MICFTRPPAIALAGEVCNAMPEFQPLPMMMMRNSRATPRSPNGSYSATRVSALSALGRSVLLAAGLLTLAFMTACSPTAEPTRAPAPTNNANANIIATRTATEPAPSPTLLPTAATNPATTAPSPAIPPTAAQPTVAPAENPGLAMPSPSPTPAPPKTPAGHLCTEEFWEAGATVASVWAELEMGADPAAKCDDGTPPLVFAVAYGSNPDIVRILLDYGADPDAVDDHSGASPLHAAAMQAAYAFHPEVQSRDPGETHRRAEFAKYSIAMLLVHRADTRTRDKYGQSALFLYLAGLVEGFVDGEESTDPVRPDPGVVELLSRGIEIRAESETDTALLSYAMLLRSGPEVIGLLLDHGAGAAAMAAGSHGDTLLHLAATFNPAPGVFELLLERGEDVAATGDKGRTALHLVALIGEAEPKAVRLLLDHGADVNAAADQGDTPLHYAASHSGPDIVKVLLERGADVAARDHSMNTPLHAAVAGGYRSDAVGGVADPEVIGMLLEAGAEVNATNADGSTALHTAAWQQDDEAARLLVASGGNVNAVDGLARTPLHRAAEFRKTWHQGPDVSIEFVRMLVELGAEVSARDRDGKTACDLARTDDPDLRSLLC